MILSSNTFSLFLNEFTTPIFFRNYQNIAKFGALIILRLTPLKTRQWNLVCPIYKVRNGIINHI